MNLIRNNILFIYDKLLCYQHKYDELLNFLLKIILLLMNLILLLYFSIVKKLNILNEKFRIGKNFLQRQVIYYSEDDFQDHQKKHFPNFNKHLDFSNSSIFICDFTVSKIIENIKNFIPSDSRMFVSMIQITLSQCVLLQIMIVCHILI